MYRIKDYVKIKNTNINGKIIRINNDNYTILSGTNKITVNLNMLEKSATSNDNRHSANINTYLNNYNQDSLDEIMLRHQFKEDAIQNLDKFIDTAICNKKHKIKIIHGKNGGVLRNAVHEYLKNNPNVDSFSLGDYYEGSYGVTIAYLK